MAVVPVVIWMSFRGEFIAASLKRDVEADAGLLPQLSAVNSSRPH